MSLNSSLTAEQAELFPHGHELNKATITEKRIEEIRQQAEDQKASATTGRPIEDWTGRRFGKLLIVAQDLEFDGPGTAWIAQCDCGEVITTTKTSLNYGTSHCGCMGWGRKGDSRPGSLGLRSHQRRSNAGVAFNQLYARYRSAAVKRGYRWQLSKKEFADITKKNCHYCGVEPRQENRHADTIYVYNGIDRVDSSKDYVAGNVVPCCGECNVAKMNRDINEFKEWVQRVYQNWAVVT